MSFFKLFISSYNIFAFFYDLLFSSTALVKSFFNFAFSSLTDFMFTSFASVVLLRTIFKLLSSPSTLTSLALNLFSDCYWSLSLFSARSVHFFSSPWSDSCFVRSIFSDSVLYSSFFLSIITDYSNYEFLVSSSSIVSSLLPLLVRIIYTFAFRSYTSIPLIINCDVRCCILDFDTSMVWSSSSLLAFKVITSESNFILTSYKILSSFLASYRFESTSTTSFLRTLFSANTFIYLKSSSLIYSAWRSISAYKFIIFSS